MALVCCHSLPINEKSKINTKLNKLLDSKSLINMWGTTQSLFDCDDLSFIFSDFNDGFHLSPSVLLGPSPKINYSKEST